MCTKTYVLPVVLSLVLALCARPPQADIDAARAALDSARAVEAAEYAPESLAAAEEALAKLDAELETQQGHLMFRSYGQAKQEAANALEAAQRATAEAVAAKELARSEASDFLARANTLLKETTELLTTAPATRGTAMDIAALRVDLQSASLMSEEAQRALDAGHYKEASVKATGAIAAIEGVRQAIEEARRSTARRS